ncbi:family 1 glycosylhydrolase [Novosphingobium olei]|uniref:Glycoside hydrolase family 1 protein n=1 Tax=Novosphingobium olei TaxID=2728851 RepID=A0A7Y0BPY2_9SPHN|nr:glycoside hydrolase family 1 protein [Novosphingobium olei]
MIDRRTLLAASAALGAVPAFGRSPVRQADGPSGFPRGFLWGASTAGHQVEGNNTNSDCWLIEHVTPTLFRESSGDACNSFLLWEQDLDLVKSIGLNSYRFSIEWARIEPAEGEFSVAMLDHYKRMIAGCRARGLAPVVTFNHYSAPRWFAADGGWTNPKAPLRFARYCERAARHLAGDMAIAMTLNEPNINHLLQLILPPEAIGGMRAMLQAAARISGSAKFSVANAVDPDDFEVFTRTIIAGHRAGRDAIKSVRSDLPVGFSLSMLDDIAVGSTSMRDRMRERLYGPWLEEAKQDDYLGVQNYEQARWTSKGRLPPERPVPGNPMGADVSPLSLAGAVRFAHAATGRPILISEHGVNTTDDAVRAAFIPASLQALKGVMDQGVPVLGYLHWSLLDNYEWVSGFHGKLGLASVDPETFARKAKPSAGVLGRIATANAL